jgi:hypothetical protein
MDKRTRGKYLGLCNIIKASVPKYGRFAHKKGAQWQSATPASPFVKQ